MYILNRHKISLAIKTFIFMIVVQMKQLLYSDWLRARHLSGNAVPKELLSAKK